MPYNSNSYGSKNKTRYALWTLQSWSYHKKYLTQKKKIEDLQEQNLTIPREPGGGTGTMASWDTNCMIKAILNLCESLVKTSGNRLQRKNIETTFGVQCRYTCDCCEWWSTVRNGCVLLIFYFARKKSQWALSIQQNLGSLMAQKVPGKLSSNSDWKFLKSKWNRSSQ